MAELGGEPQATVIGLESGLPAANAAFANGMLCHGLDFDDTHSDSVSHVSAVVTPASLAAGEAVGASGRDVLTAIVAGNEVVIRVGMAASGRFHTRGFHPTAVCGIFGGTASVGKLGGLDAETTTRALGIAGSMASGIFAYLEDGTPTKPIHPAWAAHGAHLATRLAHHGAAGPPSVFEGKFGLYHSFLAAEPGEVDIDGADRRPRLALGDSAHRLQAVPGLPLHARIARRDRPGARGRTLSPDEIDSVTVTVPAAGVSLVLEPAGQKWSRARTTRASSRSSTRWPRCSCAVMSRCRTSRRRR